MNSRRLIYALMLKNATSSGVLATLDSRLESLQTKVPGSYGLCFYRGKGPDPGRYKNVRFVRVRAKTPGLSHIFFPFYLWRWIRAFGDNPLYVVIRYHFPSPLFFVLFAKRTFALVSEHHTHLEANLSSLDGVFGKVLPLVAKALNRSTDAVIDGKIGLTEEILRRQPEKMPTLVLGNGLDDRYPTVSKYKHFDGKSLSIVTILSSDWKWNGTDLMIKNMEHWAKENPNLELELSIIGPVSETYRSANNRVKIHLLGQKNRSEIATLVSSFHVAFSSLGAWRMGLEQGCPLKSRMYVELGIPYIAGYLDPDLNEKTSFLLQCPNSPEPICWSEVHEFLSRLTSEQSEVLEHFSIARSRLSHGQKSTQLLKFLSTLRSE